MNHISNLMLKLMESEAEDEYDVVIDYDDEEDTISIYQGDDIYFEVSVMECYDAWEDECIEIVNYELDEYYQYLTEDDAFDILMMMMKNVFMGANC